MNYETKNAKIEMMSRSDLWCDVIAVTSWQSNVMAVTSDYCAS